MTPMLRTGLTHVGTALGGGLAVAMWASSNAEELYNIVNQLNVVVSETAKLFAIVVPFATAAFGVYKSSTRQKLIDVSKDPEFKGAVVDARLATEVPSHKVVDSIAQLPENARTPS